MSINTAMNIAAKALSIAQSSMDVTSNNMANVNTEGYSRQELELTPSFTYNSKYGEMGTGVTAETISRVYDAYLAKDLNRQTSLLSEHKINQSIIWNVETIFNESDDNGLNKILTDFWNAWQDLANNPEGTAERQTLIEAGQSLAHIIVQMRSDMDDQTADLNLRIEDAVKQTNSLVKEISELNQAITRAESDGSNANSLRDKRDMLLKDLAEFIEFNQFEDPSNGSVTVLTPKGYPLVEGNTYWTLSTGKDSTGNVRIYWDRTPEAHDDMTDTFERGELGGLVGIRNVLEGFVDQFDEFTSMLIKEVNRQHSQGTGLEHMTDSTGSYEISPFARLETGLSGENNDIVFVAKTAGTPGDQITVTYLDAGGVNQPFGLTVTGNNIIISLGSDENGNISTTAQDVVDFIKTDSSAEAQAARSLVSLSLAENNDGHGKLSAMSTTNLNRHLSNLLDFGEDLTDGSFDLITYDANGIPTFNTINVNPDDTREDIIAQIGETFSDGITGVRASIVTDDVGKEHLRIEADTSSGYDYAFGNDTASILMALGINTFFAGCDTTNIQINEAVKNNLSLINAGIVSSDGQTAKGSNVNALDIADLKDQTFQFQTSNSTISEAYNSLASDVGSTAATIYRNVEFTKSLVSQLEQQRDSLSAVSLDEELTNLIKFQYAYMAAAKIVSASDEMLRSMITMV